MIFAPSSGVLLWKPFHASRLSSVLLLCQGKIDDVHAALNVLTYLFFGIECRFSCALIRSQNPDAQAVSREGTMVE